MRNLVDKALDDIKKLNACVGHKWMGPIQEMEGKYDAPSWYLVNCKHCPVAKGVATRAEAVALVA